MNRPIRSILGLLLASFLGAGCGPDPTGRGGDLGRTDGTAITEAGAYALQAAAGATVFPAPVEGNTGRATRVKREIEHILACQIRETRSPAYGAINDVPPTQGASWIVPGEMAVAALVLWKAGHRHEALLAIDFLARLQNADGSWFNRYDRHIPSDLGRHSRHTAQCAIAFAVIGGYDWVVARAAAFLARLTDPALKTGIDDGLVCGGYDERNRVITDRWTSDNAYAVLAFDLAVRHAARDRVIEGINERLRTPEAWASRVDRNGKPGHDPFGWIPFAPAQLGLARLGVQVPDGLADTIARHLQEENGRHAGSLWENQGSTKRMPGIGFQAAIAWRELGGLGPEYALRHLAWAESQSGLLHARGGWIDWSDRTGSQAPAWQRFIDTSAYYVMVANGWTTTDLLR